MTIINRGCQRAIRTGAELLNVELLEQVKNDAGAEAARKEMAAAIEAGRLSTKPRSRYSKRKPRGTNSD